MPLFTLANACDRSVKERDSATISVVVDDTWCRTEVSSRTDCAFKADWMTRQVCERQSSGVWHIAQVLRRYGPNFLLPSLSLSPSQPFSLWLLGVTLLFSIALFHAPRANQPIGSQNDGRSSELTSMARVHQPRGRWTVYRRLNSRYQTQSTRFPTYVILTASSFFLSEQKIKHHAY